MNTIDYDSRTEHPPAPLVRWGPTFAGAITAIAATALGMAFWLALGFGSGITWFADNMQWFFLGTALASLLTGGVVAGRVAGARGVTIGTADGVMVWGLVVVASLIPLSLRALALANAGSPTPATQTAFGVSSGNLWALFGALVGGLACTVIGGMIGGAERRGMPSRREQYAGREPASRYDSMERERIATRAPTYDGRAPERVR
jgi:hypothetical protein